MKRKVTSQNGVRDGAPFQCKTNPPQRILLADDEPLILQLNAEVLVESGYEVDTAVDGAVAWEVLQLNRYHLLITDNDMPKVTGVDLLQKLHAARMALPVIMATGTFPHEELKQRPWLQLEARLLKPYGVDELLETVNKVLREADGLASSAQLFRDCAIQDNQISQAEEPANAPIRDQANPSHRILVVDDDNDTRQLSVDILVGSGYDVEGAKDGAAGWMALQGSNYDLVVTDNKMPNMTGIEMIAKLRSARMAVPVIMATSILPMHVIERNPWLKPDAMLQRPFSNDDLLETVRNVLHTDDGNESGKASLLPKYL